MVARLCSSRRRSNRCVALVSDCSIGRFEGYDADDQYRLTRQDQPHTSSVSLPRRVGSAAHAFEQQQRWWWWWWWRRQQSTAQRAAPGTSGEARWPDVRPAAGPLGLCARGLPALHVRGAAVPCAGHALLPPATPGERDGGADGAVGGGQPGRHGPQDPAVVLEAVGGMRRKTTQRRKGSQAHGFPCKDSHSTHTLSTPAGSQRTSRPPAPP